MSHATEPLPHWNDTAGATKGDVEAALAVVQLMEQYPGLRPIQRAIFFDTKAVLGAALHNPDATRQAFKSSTVYAKLLGLRPHNHLPEDWNAFRVMNTLMRGALDEATWNHIANLRRPNLALALTRYMAHNGVEEQARVRSKMHIGHLIHPTLERSLGTSSSHGQVQLSQRQTAVYGQTHTMAARLGRA